MKQAEWKNITWGINGNQMVHLKSFKISQNLKTEELEDKTTGASSWNGNAFISHS